jgi:hypothetical protein
MTSGDKLAQLQSVLPVNAWSPIATRPRYWPNIDEPPEWAPVENVAGLNLDTVNDLQRQGLLFKALKYTPETITVVVMPRTEPEVPKVRTSGSQSTLTEWNDHKVARLRRLWLETGENGPLHTTNEIAEILGVPPESVRTKAQRMELPARGPSNRRERLAA